MILHVSLVVTFYTAILQKCQEAVGTLNDDARREQLYIEKISRCIYQCIINIPFSQRAHCTRGCIIRVKFKCSYVHIFIYFY